MKKFFSFLFIFLVMLPRIEVAQGAALSSVRIAAASDLKFAMDEVVQEFQNRNPDFRVEVVYGSSGRFFSQIYHQAPFDLYFSADAAYPRKLIEAQKTDGLLIPYAQGRIVLWSLKQNLEQVELKNLGDLEGIKKIAIANPRHAPYGKRAVEALQAAGVWESVESRLVFADNIAQAAQFVESGAADIGIIALALVKAPALQKKGSWVLIPDSLHLPLDQAYVLTQRGRASQAAQRFSEEFQTESTRRILKKYGFVLPSKEFRSE